MENLENKVDYSGLKVESDLNAHILNSAGIDLTPVDDLFNMQKRINNEVDPQWLLKKYSWKVAILVEMVEGIDSTSWKWWKSSTNDWLNFETEMIDGLFFTIAKIIELKQEESAKIFFFNYMMQDKNTPMQPVVRDDELAKKLVKEISEDFLRIIALDHYMAIIPAWFKIWNMLGNDTTEVFKRYKLKFVLNMFRQQNGYNNKTYIKMWNGVEDNKVAIRLAEDIAYDENYEENLKEALTKEYALIKDAVPAKKPVKDFDRFIKESQRHNLLFNSMPKEVQSLFKEFSTEFLEYNMK